MDLWTRLRSEVAQLTGPALADELLAVARGEAASRLAHELGWIAYRLCPERSPVASVHVPMVIATLKESKIEPPDCIAELAAVCGDLDVEDALCTSDEVLVAEIAEAIERPRFRHRASVVDAIVASVAGEPPNATGLPTEPRFVQDPAIDAARQASRERDLATAIALAEAVVDGGDRQLVESAAVLAGVVHAKRNDLLAAVRVLERGIAVHETAWQQLMRGTYLNGLERHSDAEVALRRALALPDGLGFVLTDAYNELGYGAMRRERVAECERAATLSLLHDRASGGSWRMRIGARLAMGELAGAMRDAEALVATNEAGSAYAIRAHCRLATGDLTGAIEDERRHRESPDAYPQFVIATALWRQGKAREALRDLDLSIARHPRLGTLRLVRARVRADLEDLEGALDDLAFALGTWDRDVADVMPGFRPMTRSEAVALRAELLQRHLAAQWPDEPSAALATARSRALAGDLVAAIRALLDVLRDGGRDDRSAARTRLPLLFKSAGQSPELDSLRREATVLT